MTEAIAAGSILLEARANLPGSLLRQGEPDSNGWALVRDARFTFEKAIHEAGLTLFFMAGEIKATVIGFDRQKALRAALKRLIANVQSQRCNSIEITRVAGKSFLGVPYVTVFAHPRHLQKGLLFSGQQ